MWSEKSYPDSTGSEDSDDCYDPFITDKELEDTEKQSYCLPRRRFRLAGYLACGTLWGSTLL
jgi:hypothetical protein